MDGCPPNALLRNVNHSSVRIHFKISQSLISKCEPLYPSECLKRIQTTPGIPGPKPIGSWPSGSVLDQLGPGPGPRTISKPGTRLNQDREWFHSLGLDRTRTQQNLKTGPIRTGRSPDWRSVDPCSIHTTVYHLWLILFLAFFFHFSEKKNKKKNISFLALSFIAAFTD